MLKRPKIAGAAQLKLFVDEIGFAESCATLDIHPATLRKWLRGGAPVPQAALQALYWLTSWGFSDAAAEVHWSHQFMLAKLREYERALGLRPAPDLASANEAASEPAAAPARPRLRQV